MNQRALSTHLESTQSTQRALRISEKETNHDFIIPSEPKILRLVYQQTQIVFDPGANLQLKLNVDAILNSNRISSSFYSTYADVHIKLVTIEFLNYLQLTNHI